MGLGRKVGAFLGLVPEDQGKYADADYDGRYEGEGYDERSYDADYDRRGYDSADRFEDREPVRYPEGGYDRSRSADRGRSAGRGSFDSDTRVQGALAVKVDPAPPVRAVDPVASTRPTTVRLTGFGEARLIGEKYRDGQSVILDMTDMSDSDARRLVDFSAGLAFAMRGSIDKVAPKVFMLLPPDADVSAAAADYHASHVER